MKQQTINKNKRSNDIQAAGERRMIGEENTSHFLSVSRSWLRQARMKNSGPPYIRIGKSIRYDILDLIQWIEKQRIE